MKIAIYTRVSTHHQIDKDSLPLQKNDLINYCRYVLNTDKYEIFEDAGYSGKNTDRPAFKSMMNKIRNGKFTHLLVWKIDRISRNLLDFCDMYEEIKKHNCVFISKNEQFDTSSAMGEAMLKIILVFAELERKLTGERVTAVMLDRASKGLWNGAPIPLGYVWNKEIKFPIPDDSERKTVELIFNKYLECRSTTVVREYLNSNNIKTKKDGTWTTKTISDIIRNPFYKGTYRYNYREPARGKKKKGNEVILIDDNHESIITKELWEKCNDIMDVNSKKNNAAGFRANGKIHVLAGLLECGECHKSLYSKQDKPHLDGFRPSLYICSGRYNDLNCTQKTISEKIVATFVLTFISNMLKLSKKLNIDNFENELLKGNVFKDIVGIDGIEELFNALMGKQQKILSFRKATNVATNIDIEKLNKDKSKYIRALERLEDLYLFDDSNMSEKDYILKKNKIEEKLKEITLKLNATKKEDNTATINELSFLIETSNAVLVKKVLELKKIDYKNLLNEVGRGMVKDFMNTIIKKIVVKDRRIISISFKNSITIGFVYR